MPDRRTLATLAAGAVVLASRRAAAAIGAAVRQSARRAVHQAHQQSAVIVLGAALMATSVARAIVSSRTSAREGSLRRLRAEFAAANLPIALRERNLVRAAAIDEAAAATAAKSLADQWRALAETAAATEGSPYRAIAVATPSMRPRVERTAQTEVARAYSNEHLVALTDVSVEPAFYEATRSLQVVRQWSAMLESCPICSELDGEQTTISGSFSGGVEPGDVHPRCMCTWFLTVA